MQDSSSQTTKDDRPPHSRGIILRLAFFFGTVLCFLLLLPGILQAVFGSVVGATMGVFGAGLLANLLTMRIFDRRPLSDIGLGGAKGTGRNFLLGGVLGGVAAVVMLCGPLMAGAAHFMPKQNSAFAWSSLLFYLAVLLFGAAGEEMIFRGYAFQLLVKKMGPFATVLPFGVLFGLAHTLNPSASMLALLNTTLWGILLGYAFLRSHDLWLPIGLHYGWNAVLPLFGVNLSGLTIDVTRYFYRWDLTSLWSGGDYGPEGGLLTTIFVIGLFFLLVKAPVAPQVAAIAENLNE